MTLLQHIFITIISSVLSHTGRHGMLIILGVLGFGFFSPLQGQPLTATANPSGISADVFGGPAITTLGLGAMAGITVGNGGHQFIIRGVSTDMEPANETWEIAGLYGRVIGVDTFQLSAGVGVGIVGGRGYSQLFAAGSPESFETMIGFPIEGKVVWKPVRLAGIGLYSFANINTVQPLGGFALTLHLGF